MNKIRKIIKTLKGIYKYGGFCQVKCSSIYYKGGLFSKETLVLITGGTKGIGYSMAERFIEAGATVVVTGRNANNCKLSDSLYSVRWDINDISIIESMLDKVENMTGKKIHILINNAGIYAKSQFPNCTSEDWDSVYQTNAKGPFFLCQSLCKRWSDKIKQNEAPKKIINICSQGGFSIANNPYRMTKWDIRGLTAFLGKYYCNKGIITNAIAPGLVMTDMQPKFKKQGDNYYTNQNPLHRLAEPFEIANLAVFLASDAANFIVGQTICCDGGYSI